MRAWRAGAYAPGGDVAAALKAGTAVTLERLPVPAPAAGEVRVKVSYAAVNPIDWKLLTGGLHAAAPVSFPATLGSTCRAWWTPWAPAWTTPSWASAPR